jgi:hypothetical protein
MKFINLFLIIGGIFSFGFSQTQKAEKVKYITGSIESSFYKNISELGKSGYQLKSVVSINDKYSKNIEYAGLMEFVEGETFDYLSFYVNSLFTLVTRLRSYQSVGYSIADSVPILENGDAKGCDDGDFLCIGNNQDFDYQVIGGNVIFLERRNGIKNITNLEILEVKDISWKTDYSKLEALRAKGFLPIRLLYTQNNRNGEYIFILQKQSKAEADLQIVTVPLFGYDKKITAFTKNGYILTSSLYLTGLTEFALMIKPQNSDLEISRIIYPKDIKPKELAKTRMKFKSVLWSFKGYERGYEKEKLQFIEPTDSKTEYSYKIVKMKQLKPGKPIDSIEPSKDATSEYKSLVAQGYVIKDLYIYNGINMLLEKVIK